jgi:hypothetical protein
MSSSIFYWILAALIIGGAVGGTYFLYKISLIGNAPVSKAAEEKYKDL